MSIKTNNTDSGSRAENINNANTIGAIKKRERSSFFERGRKKNSKSEKSQPDRVLRSGAGIARTYELPNHNHDEKPAEEKKPFIAPSWMKISLFIGIPVIAGLFISLLTFPFADAYSSYILPPFALAIQYWSPLFLLLMAMFGLSVYFVWKAAVGARRTRTLALLIAQLALTFAWPLLFFHFKLLMISACEMIVLALVTCSTNDNLERINKYALYLNFPYFLFCSYLAYLSTCIALLN